MKKNRFKKRREKSVRVFYAGLCKDQIAELDEDGRIVVTNINRHMPRFETTYFTQAPRFSENHKVEAGSAQEKNEVDYMVRNAQPLFEDKKQGVTLYR
jgi:hypothetical protein